MFSNNAAILRSCRDWCNENLPDEVIATIDRSQPLRDSLPTLYRSLGFNDFLLTDTIRDTHRRFVQYCEESGITGAKNV